MAADFATTLRDALGEDIIALGDAIDARFWHDWSGLDPVQPLALARPRTTEQVSAILALCHAARVAVVPQGGLTGLAGGAQPIAGGIVLSLERMRGIEEIDPVMATMTVQAGTPLIEIQQAAEAADLFFALDLGARGSCAIGGNLATNAGGNRVIRYGMAREQVLGLEVVLPDGTIIRSLNKMLKNNAAYDLKQLFIGSEGTLGVITRAVLRLQARPTEFATAFCACADFAGVLALLQTTRAKLGPALSSFEVMWPSFYDFMTAGVPTLRRPFSVSHGAYVLIEASGFAGGNEAARLEACIADLLDIGAVLDAVVAASEQDARDLWAVRESVTEYGRLMGPITAFDVSLPTTAIGAAVARLEPALAGRWPGVVALSYGHIGDSNLHLVIHVPSAGAHQPHDEICDLVYGAVRDAGGSISAEHGIGLLKKPYLGYSRTPAELALMATLKAAIDPANILNPGKVLTRS